jgi:carboxyl-terminal processing protease
MLAKIMRTSARIAILVVLAACSVAVGIKLGAWTFRRTSPLAGATAASEPRMIGVSEAGSTSWSDVSDPLETMRDVLEMMQSEYVDKVEADGKFSASAVRTMLYTLDDPRTRYWTDEQTRSLERQMDGKFTGIGAVIAVVKEKRNEVEQRRVRVIAPAPGGPCDRAGIRAGDYITEVDGRWVIAYDPRLDLNRLALRNMPDKEYRRIIKDATKKLTDGISWPRALEQLTQATGKELQLTLERPGAKAPIKVKVARAATEVTPVEFRKVTPAVGYLRVSVFSTSAPGEAAAALQSAGKPQKLILDLRDNAGGPDEAGPRSVVASATGVMAALGVGGNVGTIAKGSTKKPIVAAANGGKAPSMAVLINKGTSGIAELVAAALRTRAGAKLLGASSQGDSSYCKLVKLSQGSMTVTSGTFLTVSGKPVPATGLQPDTSVPTAGPRFEKDAAVARALAVLGQAGGGRP